MKGKVNARREAMIHLRACGRGKMSRSVRAIIDTGYTGSLTLPRGIIEALGLRRIASRDAELGDGRVISFDVYAGAVIWNGQKRFFDIDEAQTEPLIGMDLLEGHELNIRIRPGGDVEITPLHLTAS